MDWNDEDYFSSIIMGGLGAVAKAGLPGGRLGGLLPERLVLVQVPGGTCAPTRFVSDSNFILIQF